MVDFFRLIPYSEHIMDYAGRTELKHLLEENQALLMALGDPSRQKIFLLMADTVRQSVGEIAAAMEVSRPTVSHHIKILRDADLVREQRIGVRRYYYPCFDSHIGTLKRMVALLEQLHDNESKG